MAAEQTEPSALPEPTDSSAPAEQPAVDEPEHWWQADGMPWQGRKPGRRDIACLTAIFAVAVYTLIMLPLRPVMLGFTPHLLASTGDPWWPLLLVLASAMAMKFDWIYWWAGKLWGRGIIEMWSGRSPRARKRNARAEKLALKYETLAILLTYLPIPIPSAVIYAVLGWAGTSLRKFLIVDAIGALLSTAAYMGLGYLLGAPAVQIVEQYNQYLWYVSLVILVFMVGSVFVNERRRGRGKDASVEPVDGATREATPEA
jgi:membrane protein DedA with SNARE-associated domain